MKEALGAFVRVTRLDALVRFAFARRRVTIAVYHNPSPETLRTHLAYFARRYSFITMDAFERALTGKRWHELPRYPLVVTIDDGHAGNAQLEALFREFGVRPTIYLCSQIVGTARPFWWQTAAAAALGAESLKGLADGQRLETLRQAGCDLTVTDGPRQALTWEEVRALSAVADFGGHTRHHPILPRCDDAACAEEVAVCKQEVEAALAQPCRHFAYPNGDYGEREIAELKRAGYATGRTIEVGWNGPDADPFRLKVMPVYDHASLNWLVAQMTGLPSWLRHVRMKRRPHPVPVAGVRPAHARV
jgi:peptidoglycan/xylan/chitin deacetylase (PgdA/CDA1 family)